MKFLMISQCGEGAGILKQIADEGNSCEIFIKEELYDSVYDGLLDKTYDIDPDPNTIVIFDMSGNGDIADDLIKSGHKVFGSSSFADQLESDRMFGLDVMKSCGIKLPETEEFKDFEDVPEFLDQHPDKKFVFKPSGKMPCKLTYCSEDNDELLEYLKFVDIEYGDKIDSFVLQEFVEGTVVSSEIFFNGERIVGEPNHTVEEKKFMNDNLGPSTGCMGNLVWLDPDSKIVKNGVAKIEDILKKEGYIGQVDLNCVVNDSGIYGLEWTPRFGYDATPTYLRMLGIEYGKFFSDICEGKLKSWPHKCKEQFAVRFSIPPFPAEPEGEKDEEKIQKVLANFGIPIRHWETYNKNLYFYEVMLNDSDKLVHSNGLGVIGLVCHENPKRVYEILEKIKIPDMQYRTDLIKVLEKAQGEARKYA